MNSACMDVCLCMVRAQTMQMYVLEAHTLRWAHLKKVFSVTSISQQTSYYSVDRFITPRPNDISELFLGFVGIKVHFEDPDYVTGSLCLQAFDTDKRMAAAVADEPR